MHGALFFEFFGIMALTAYKMLRDALHWFVFMILVVMAFSLPISSLLYVNHQSKDLFWAFWSLFSDTSDARDQAQKLAWPWSAWAKFMIYVLCVAANLLLMNLLVAIMNNTYESVRADSKTQWACIRITAILEYDNYSSLPPPLNLLKVPWMFLRSILRLGRIQHFSREDQPENNEEGKTDVPRHLKIITKRDLKEAKIRVLKRRRAEETSKG